MQAPGPNVPLKIVNFRCYVDCMFVHLITCFLLLLVTCFLLFSLYFFFHIYLLSFLLRMGLLRFLAGCRKG